MKIVENRKMFYGLSLSIIIIGLAFMCYYAFGKGEGILNYGLEFTGGTAVTIDIKKDYNKADVEAIVAGITGNKTAQVQKAEDSYDVIIKLAETTRADKELVAPKKAELADGEEDAEVVKSNEEVIYNALKGSNKDDKNSTLVIEAINEKYDLTEENLISVSQISETIGSEMTSNAVQSILLATIAILIYITYRFKDTKLGIAAVVALVHDVMVLLSVYAVFRIPVGNSFVAALLTIVGYSINDTIVLFDRVRENNRGNAKSDKAALINRSVESTFTRTLNTSITTLLSIIVLGVLGVSAIREFTIPMAIGIVVGTYSSIFVSTTLWYDMVSYTKKNKAKKA